MTHPVDVHVGRRIRHRRWMVGKTQQNLADAVGIKFQQIQKYETGANRVSASRLYDIAKTLETPISFFFEEMEGQSAETGTDQTNLLAGEVPGISAGQFTDKEALDFLRYYYRMDEEPRRRLFELARSIAKAA